MKTYSREMSIILILYLMGMGSGMYGSYEMLQALVYPFTGFAMLGFAMNGHFLQMGVHSDSNGGYGAFADIGDHNLMDKAE